MNSNFSNTSKFSYNPSQDLNAMIYAKNYHRWIISMFADDIRNGVILEVGAGIGSFSTEILESGIVSAKNLYLLEPSTNLIEKLAGNVSKYGLKTDHIFKGYLSENFQSIKNLKVNAIIYNNVFEHIENDLEEMRLAYQLLCNNGVLLGYTPATKFLYSKFDRLLGHYRRYSKKEMTMKLKSAGFKNIRVEYKDLLGVLVWLLNFKILKKNNNNPKQMEIYDKYIFPVFNKLDFSGVFNIGKNIYSRGIK